MPQIEAIVFDVGRVLFEFTFLPFELLMREHGYTETKEKFLRDIKLHDYERGQITSDQFLERLNELLPVKPDRESLISVYSDIFTPNNEMLELAAELRNTHRTYLLSNTSELHWEVLERKHGINTITHGVVTSFQAKEMKPHPDIYRFAENTLGLTPANTVFIDDMLENIDAVKAAGWHGIHHVSFELTKRELENLGVI